MMTLEERKLNKLTGLEAALYSAGRPLNVEELMQAIGTRSESVVDKFVDALIAKLDARGCALEVRRLSGKRVAMQLRSPYGEMVRQFTNKPLLTVGPLKTLGYIAYNQPVEQAQVLDYRGVHVYTQLRILESMALISRERTERGVVIKTTHFFADYFGFSQDPGKSRLQIIELFSNLHPELMARG